MEIYIGTSGWQYGDWQGLYPKALASWQYLPFYVHCLNSVEINVSFYRMVRKKTFEGWSHVGKENSSFRFSVKLNNRFTRERKLNLDAGDVEQLEEFLNNSNGLGKALGPVLCQLPPSLHLDLRLLERFLKTFFSLTKKINPEIKLAVEFRHASWLVEGTYKLLKKYGAAFVISDSSRWPTEYIKTSDFVYIRLHGKPRMFYSLYSETELRELLQKIKQLKPKAAYIYFNNTMRGHAAENALELKSLLGKQKTSAN